MKVLLLDEGFVSGTRTAFGLRQAGCDVHVLAATGGSGRCAGTGGTWRFVPRVGDSRLMPTIDAAVRAGAFDVVYPLTEPLQWMLWDERPDWNDLVFPSVARPQRENRRDKRLMSILAAGAGIPVPRELPAANDDEVGVAAWELGLPVVLKASVGRGGNATAIAMSAAGARRAAGRLRMRGSPVFAQAFVAGHTFLVGGVFDRGRALRLYAGLKTVQFPARTGPAAELLSIDDPALLSVALRVFAAANVTGLASADFQGAPGGDYQFLELNPRPWGSIAAAGDAGVDLFSPLVDLWRGASPTASVAFRSGVRSPVAPLYLLAQHYWSSFRAPRAAASDAAVVARFVTREPQLAWHLAQRLIRVGRNW